MKCFVHLEVEKVRKSGEGLEWRQVQVREVRLDPINRAASSPGKQKLKNNFQNH